MIAEASAVVTAAMNIPGWTPPVMLALLADLARGKQTVVEIGSWLGRSAVAMAQTCAGTVYCVDTWHGDAGTQAQAGPVDDPLAHYRKFLAHIAQAGVSYKIAPLFQDSRQAHALFARTPIDLLYIDSDHAYNSVWDDLSNWTPLLAPDGVVCGDDYNYVSVKQAVESFFEERWLLRVEAGGRMFIAERIK
jgi:predicted O-methyltransferase YrrM